MNWVVSGCNEELVHLDKFNYRNSNINVLPIIFTSSIGVPKNIDFRLIIIDYIL